MAVEAYVRRTHLGHGHAYKAPGKYSHIETTIDRIMEKTYGKYFTLRVFEPERFEGKREEEVLEKLANAACKIARDHGIGCVVLTDDVPRPIFFSGNMVYVTGFFGEWRDRPIGMAHPTVFLLDRPANAYIARWLGKNWGHLADEGRLEEIARRCVESGYCEVKLKLSDEGLSLEGIRPII